MTLQIRELSPQDAEPFKAFQVAALKESPDSFSEDASEMGAHSLELVAALLAAPGTSIFGAFLQDHLLGSVGMHCQNRIKTKHIVHLWGMYVIPAHRKKGFARELTQHLLSEVQKLPQIEQIKLSVVSKNLAAIKLYKSLGFQTYGTDPRAIQSGGEYLDEYLMVKHL